MEDLGVLVQHYGIKQKGKAAPMAATNSNPRRTQKSFNSASMDRPFNSKSFSANTQNFNSEKGSFLDDQDDIFGFSSSTNKPQSYATSHDDVFDGVFQMPTKKYSFPSYGNGGGGGGVDFDIESMFKGSVNLNKSANVSDVDDDLIWGFSGVKGSNGVAGGNDLLSSDPVDDFLGNLGNLGSKTGKNMNKGINVDSDDLLPGFGKSNAANDRAQASFTEKSSGLSSLEELEEFATGTMKKTSKGGLKGGLDASAVKNEPTKTVRHQSREPNFIDIDGSFDGDGLDTGKVERQSADMFQAEASDLESFFQTHPQKSVPVSEDTSMNMKTEEVPDMFSGTRTTFSTKIKAPSRGFSDDFTFIFEGEQASGQFEEVEGEAPDRRKLRFERHQRAEARKRKALEEMKQREFEAQQEQEERYRIGETMDVEMKRWAAGKEGNLRALLSSLQQVLAPELGWRPVGLTDLITSSQVKIAYKRAALCVHPDKVQQKGASLQQKFVAEKVFDLLKEAWNKFNSEELR